VVVAAILLRVAYVAAGVFELAPDEAVYWQYSRRPDWCYYTKGPLVAYLIWIGTHVFGHTELGVRISSIVLAAVTMVLFCRLYERIAPGERRGVVGLLIAQHCIPLFLAGSILMTIDNPLCFAWVLGLWGLHRAVRDERKWGWFWLAFALAAGLMAKLAMFFFIPVVLLYLGLSRRNRRWLATPYPYLALLGGLLALLPQVWWNAQHDWLMFRHTAERGENIRFDRVLTYPFMFIGGQMGVASPVAFVLMVIAAAHHVRHWRKDASLLVVSALAPPALFFSGFSLMHRINENWPATMYPALLLGAALYWAPKWGSREARRWVVAAYIVGAVMILLLLWPQACVATATAVSWGAKAVELPIDLPADRVPVNRLLGWRKMALFAAERAKGLEKPVFFMGRRADEASLLAFYLPEHPWTYAHPHAEISTQYGIWGGLGKLRGWNAVFVTRLRPMRHGDLEQEHLAPRDLFGEVDEGEDLEFEVAGHVVNRYEVWRCKNFRGW